MTQITTIKVSISVRDQLKEQASAAEVTLGDYLAMLARRGEREARFRRLRAQMAATPPDLMASWVEETREWERAELSDGTRLV